MGVLALAVVGNATAPPTRHASLQYQRTLDHTVKQPFCSPPTVLGRDRLSSVVRVHWELWRTAESG